MRVGAWIASTLVVTAGFLVYRTHVLRLEELATALRYRDHGRIGATARSDILRHPIVEAAALDYLSAALQGYRDDHGTMGFVLQMMNPSERLLELAMGYMLERDRSRYVAGASVVQNIVMGQEVRVDAGVLMRLVIVYACARTHVARTVARRSLFIGGCKAWNLFVCRH